MMLNSIGFPLTFRTDILTCVHGQQAAIHFGFTEH